jgi:IS30 family transposase
MHTNKTPPEGLAGMKKPRLTAMDRLAIEAGLDAGKTPYAIAQDIGRPPKTVMREIRGRAVESDKGAVGRVNNRCAHRYECTRRDVCKACYQRRSMQCKFCRQCNSHCPEFLEDKCARLEASPFVCNGCKDKNRCTLRKRFYRNGPAMENYRTVLVESRRGVNVTEAELLKFDKLLYRLTKNGQSVHAAVVNNPELFTVSEKTLYRYIDGGLLSTKNGDLPRKCRLRPRKGKGAEHKVDAKCRIGRDWECYQKFIAEHPGLPLTEMDTVEGTKGGKVLLTLMFMPYCFMLAFLMDEKTAANVSAAFAAIRGKLVGKFGKDAGLAMMTELFFVLLTDNGTEFTLPDEIEKDCEGNKVANLFYANPGASYQKPHVERNHEFIRLVLPKGSHYFLPTSFDDLTQDDVDLMMSHINSYVREASGDKTPYDLMTRRFGVEFADLFNIRRIPANDIVLKPSLLGIKQKVRPEITKATNPKSSKK